LHELRSFINPIISLKKSKSEVKILPLFILPKSIFFIKPQNFKNLWLISSMALKLLLFSVMKEKLLFLIAPLILLSLLAYPAYSEERDLFSKLKIQSIVDKKKLLIFF